MSLLKEFFEHKNKTIESFNLVSADISTLNLNLLNARTMLASVEEKITELGTKVSEINQNLRADIEIQNSTNASMASKIVDINSFVNSRIGNFEREIGKIGQKVEIKVKDSTNGISKKTTANSSLLKEIAARSKSQSLELGQLKKALKDSKEQARKLKNLLNRKITAANRAGSEFGAKIKSHKKRMQQLNRKIDAAAGKKLTSRRAARKTSGAARKIITKTITPKRTVTTIKTPKRKITRTVTKNKVVTKKETPKTKKVYEVIREKNPLI